MRKIMLYTNKPWHRIYNRERNEKHISAYSTEILLYSFFICGLIMGSVLYSSKNELNSLLDLISEKLISKQIKYIIINEICIHFCSVIFCVFCAYSCFGTIPIVFCSFLKGLYFSLIVSKLISYDIKGLGYFSLVLLPGSVLSVCATVSHCKESILMTRSVRSLIFQNDTKTLEEKRYLSKTGICISMLFLSVAFDCVFSFLFSGLF